jgi:glycine/D-amino acid oxidase-like deaminating enzyme/nitrite reductase/ring-hydroxylating ferredoxin subunit
MEANDSLWSATCVARTFDRLEADTDADVVVVGGGITGLTSAYLLASAGKRVVLLEARRLGRGVSHRSTAHLTEAVDARYMQIESDFGKEGARLVAESSRAAIEKVAELAARVSTDPGLVRRTGYLFTERADHVERLVKEYEACGRAGVVVERLARAPLPFTTRIALAFPNQAQMNIQRYLVGLAGEASMLGVPIHEDSRVIAIEDGEPCVVHLEHGPSVRAKHVFVATHAPLNRVFLQTKIAAYRSYVVAFRDAQIHDGLFWDTEDPYHYFSTYAIDDVPWLIVGGEDHKTGATKDTKACFDQLAVWAQARLPAERPMFAWSAQVEEPVDGLPFIGRNSVSKNVFVATGFGGNGTTFGTIAAMIVTDAVLGRDNAWADVYTATRVKPIGAATTYLRENVDFPMHLVSDHLHPPEAKSLEAIRPGEGKTVRVRGERLAVYRDPDGAVHALSSVCTHLGCVVRFNQAEKTWDCPCHGSRFAVDGRVLDGPAKRALERREVGEPLSAEPAIRTSTSTRSRYW